jgi:predicted Na+-dependent transporter
VVGILYNCCHLIIPEYRRKESHRALIIINAGSSILFSLLLMLTARIPIRHWQFSREDTVAMMFCGATKSVAMGVPLINVLYSPGDQVMIGLLSLPLILYHVEQLILGAIEVLILKRWVTKGLKEQLANPEDNVSVQSDKVVKPETYDIIIRF